MSNAIQVSLLRPDSIPTIWERIEGWIQQCAEVSLAVDAASDYYHKLVTGFTGMFVVTCGHEIKGVILFQRIEYPSVNICHVEALAGVEIGTWIDDANDAVYNWATTHNCQLIRAEGRPGWNKFYKNQGWHMDRVIYSRPVLQNMH